uniref:PLP homeostasis protein n=1 Tax=Oryza sativa subsp. japonica TaxID=39947 RepID=Q65XE0_ORYSJ|nr:unknown protein [Oryza sativa Japonica Group]
MASVAAAEGAAAALRSVLSRAQQAAARSGRAPESVRVVAVSKTKPVGVIRGVYDAGHRCFGENYVQELIDKASQLPEDIEWHFIGNLQSNKARALLAGVPNLDMVESVDDQKIANRLDRVVADLGRKPLKVLVQALANCRKEVCKELGIPEEQCELSMGMSADFEQAIEMGSTNVRVGSTIFGAREYPKKN